MTEPAMQRHGLESLLQDAADRNAGNVSVDIRIQTGLSQVNLRGDADDDQFLKAVEKVLGQALPLEANTVTASSQRAYWLGPNEWLIISASASLANKLQEALTGISSAVNDVSGGQIVLRVTGSHARDVMARGCTLDFHPREFTVGECAQSGLAKASVLIGLPESDDSFDIVVRRSFSDYLVRWLQHTASTLPES